ncbi:MAG: branched-chain amino acid aminotransferase [Alphaproteobacteria bacterium]|nr:branched-chain amino acid aminotransferase [Alphaproteobacteria bacterium]
MTAHTHSDGRWVEGNPPLIGPLDHAFWFATQVFDGARAFDGVAPDLERHMARVLRSATVMGLEPRWSAEEIVALAHDGIRRFPPGSALYIRPTIFPERGFLLPDPESARLVLTVEAMALPEPTPFSATLSSRRRPAPDTAPTLAKAACLYPNTMLALAEAGRRGFQNAVVLDPDGHVAEFAAANLFIAKDGQVHTPLPNGTFLDGITRQRVIALLRAAGLEVIERPLAYGEVLDADEIFSTGNYHKVAPCGRIEDRHLQPGPIAAKARALYFEFARSGPRV